MKSVWPLGNTRRGWQGVGRAMPSRLSFCQQRVCDFRSGRLARPIVLRSRHMSPRSRFVLPALLAVVALVCIRLGVWQLHRLAGRRAANRAALAARSEPELDLAQVADTAGTARLANRRVRAVGQYD